MIMNRKAPTAKAMWSKPGVLTHDGNAGTGAEAGGTVKSQSAWYINQVPGWPGMNYTMRTDLENSEATMSDMPTPR